MKEDISIRLAKWGIFILWGLTSLVSTIHLVDFFKISNTLLWSWVLAISFELGSTTSLLSLVLLKRIKGELIMGVFILLFLMQIGGNVFHAWLYMDPLPSRSWFQLVGLGEWEDDDRKRVLAIVLGVPLPLISLGFIKSLVDYIVKKDVEKTLDEPNLEYHGQQLEHISNPLEDEENSIESKMDSTLGSDPQKGNISEQIEEPAHNGKVEEEPVKESPAEELEPDIKIPQVSPEKVTTIREGGSGPKRKGPKKGTGSGTKPIPIEDIVQSIEGGVKRKIEANKPHYR